MRREYREGFPPRPTSVGDAVMHVGIAYPRWRGKHSRRMRTRNFTHLVRSPQWSQWERRIFYVMLDTDDMISESLDVFESVW